jgi:hypothetical protein
MKTGVLVMTHSIPKRIQIGWQVYRLLGFRDHWKQNGDFIELIGYEALCARCGAPFDARTTKSLLINAGIGRTSALGANRTCQDGGNDANDPDLT